MTQSSPPSAAARTADAAHWREIQELFAHVEGLPLGEREGTLNDVCKNTIVRARVLELLRAADAMDRAMQSGTKGATVGGAEAGTEGSLAARAPPVVHLGPYRLVRELGAGGIGAVYLAERSVDGVTLTSAVKILAPHAVDASFVDRFHREQENLAALDHPNITRLLDAGRDANDRPYLVMEYVQGVHLDAYCDAQRLDVRARLALFLQICAAVSHAHRNLIVHLDLKPSNVLVTAGGVVKLLDFGTSKLMRADGTLTATLMATPAYASPEQMLNQPVSTASDVYGLGAILYELLTGRAPFAKTSTAGRTEAAVREVEPGSITRAVTPEAALLRASTETRLRQALRGDLAAIVATCLRSKAAARYSSVEALSEDIRRFAESRPVLARRQTAAYLVAKFLRRRRLPLGISAALLLTVAITVSYAWTQQRQALREAERSVRMQTLLSSLFKMANPNYTGKPAATVPELLRVGLAKLPDFIRDPGDLRQAQLSLAESMFESGDLTDARGAFANIIAEATQAGALGDKAEAEAFAAEIEFQDGNIAAGRGLAADALALSKTAGVSARVHVLAEIYYAFNEENNGYLKDTNLELLRAAVAESRSRHLSEHDTTLALRDLAGALYNRGRNVEAKAIFEQLLPLYANDPLGLCDRSEVYGWLAWIDNTSGDRAASLPLFKQAYEGYLACAGADSRGALDELPYWADALTRLGRASEAVTMLEQALPIWRRLLGDSSDQSEMLYFLARAYLVVGRYRDADRFAVENLERLTGKLAPDDRNIGLAHLVLGQALLGEGRAREAAPHARKAVELLVASAATDYGRALGAEATQLAAHVEAALARRTDAP